MRAMAQKSVAICESTVMPRYTDPMPEHREMIEICTPFAGVGFKPAVTGVLVEPQRSPKTGQ
jgi:hypothetical protein